VRRGERNATLADLGHLAWAVLLFELVVAGLAHWARGFLGPGVALWVGLGLGALVLAAFLLITGASLIASHVAGFLEQRRRDRDRDRRR
jgi:hypothetical protein